MKMSQQFILFCFLNSPFKKERHMTHLCKRILDPGQRTHDYVVSAVDTLVSQTSYMHKDQFPPWPLVAGRQDKRDHSLRLLCVAHRPPYLSPTHDDFFFPIIQRSQPSNLPSFILFSPLWVLSCFVKFISIWKMPKHPTCKPCVEWLDRITLSYAGSHWLWDLLPWPLIACPRV